MMRRGSDRSCDDDASQGAPVGRLHEGIEDQGPGSPRTAIRAAGGALLFALLMSCDAGPKVPADCHPTYGRQCDCDHKCMTDAEEAAIHDFCDLGCLDTDTGANGYSWTCTVADGACVVVE